MKANVEISDWYFNCDSEQIATCGNCGHKVKLTEVTPHCPMCGARMLNYMDVPCLGYRIENGQSICYGTKEKEQCNCGGDKRLCDFYE